LSKKGTGADSSIGSFEAKADLLIGSSKAVAGSIETSADEEVRAAVGPCAASRSVVRADAAIAPIEVSRPAVPTAVKGVSC